MVDSSENPSQTPDVAPGTSNGTALPITYRDGRGERTHGNGGRGPVVTRADIQERVLLSVLERARENVKRGWTRGAYARANTRGAETSVSPTNPDATCWCAMGALERATADECAASGIESPYMREAYVREAADALFEGITGAPPARAWMTFTQSLIFDANDRLRDDEGQLRMYEAFTRAIDARTEARNDD